MGGVDWQAVHDEFRPKIEKAETAAEARDLLNQMIGRLGLSHFAIFPVEVYDRMNSPSGDATSSGTAGVDVLFVNKSALVASVEPGSPAALAGVHAGWEITKIATVDVRPLIESILAVKPPHADLVLKRAVLSRLNGDTTGRVTVEFLNAADKPVTLTLNRVAPKGTIARFGFLPPMAVWMDTRKLAGEVEYIRFNQFFEPTVLMSQFEDAVRSCLKCKGVVIDLRGNTGGIGAMAMGMAGWFIDKPNQKLGTMIMRDVTMKFVINPRAETYSGPLAILTDGASASTSEILAGGLQDLKRARIFGTRSAAAALPSEVIKLPNGDGFQYAQANYVSEGGKPLEGVGVTPDVEVRPTRQALLENHDRPLEAAIEWITHHE